MYISEGRISFQSIDDFKVPIIIIKMEMGSICDIRMTENHCSEKTTLRPTCCSTSYLKIQTCHLFQPDF